MSQEIIEKDGVKLEDLKPKEIETLSLLLMCKTDTEVIKLGPYKMAMFYRIKPKLEPYRRLLAEKLREDALSTIRAGSLEAANELVKMMKSKDRKYSAILQILDRAGIQAPAAPVNIPIDARQQTIQIELTEDKNETKTDPSAVENLEGQPPVQSDRGRSEVRQDDVILG